MKRVVLCYLVIFGAGCQSKSTRVSYIDLQGSLDPLRDQFNAYAHLPRVIALFSPT